MKRNVLMSMVAAAIVLGGFGTAQTAIAQASNVNEDAAISRVCNPDSFDAVRRTDFRGINLNRRQQQTIQRAYQTYLNWVTQNLATSTCFKDGALTQPYLTEYAKYDAVVRRTLNRNQLKQFEKNLDAVLRRR